WSRGASTVVLADDDGQSQLPLRPLSCGINISDHIAGATLMVPARCMKSTKFMTLLGVVENWVSGSSRIFSTSSFEILVFDERTNISAASFLFLAMNSFASSRAASMASDVFGLASTNFLG